jgi:hypothetical protein
VPLPIPNFISNLLFRPIVRPILRFLSGMIAIPIFRFILRRVLRVQTTDVELERDLEHWFRASLVLLAATANLESFLFGWLPWQKVDEPWLLMLFRLLLAVGVIENMPNQDLFAMLHRGPPKFAFTSRAGWHQAWRERWWYAKGLLMLHLKRSSPVFVIMAVVFGGHVGSVDWRVGWWCYGLAIGQYLIIALITDRDRVEGILQAFEKETARLRGELVEATPRRRD